MHIFRRPIIYICIYIVILSTVAIIKHKLFHTYAFDLGIFIQALYTTWSEQKILFETPDSIISESYLGIHFSPILFLFIPLVVLFPPAETLLLLQTIILALPAYLLYKDVYIETKSEKIASFICIWYLLNPALHCVNLYDFHTQSLMILPSYLLVRELRKHNIVKSVIYLILLFTINEQALFIGLGCILYLLTTELYCRRKIWVKGLITITFTTTLMTIIAFTVISTFGKPPVHPENPTKLFPQLGSTWAEVLNNIFSWRIIDAVTYDASLKILYWLVLLFPLYMCDWRVVIREAIPLLLPWMLFTFISGYKPFYTIGWQFNGLVLGIISASTLETLRKCKHIKSIFRKYVVAMFILTVLISPLSVIPCYTLKNILYVTKGGAYDFNPFSANILEELEIASTIRKAISLIPENASILCTSNIFPHVATRSNAYVGNVQDVEYILLDYRFVNFGYFGQRVLQIVSELNKSHKYGVLMYANGILLLKKNYTSQPLLLKPYEIHVTSRMLAWYEIIPEFSDEGYAILRLSTEDERLIWFGPYITVPPGLYEIKINVSRNFEGKLMIEVVNFVDDGKKLATSYEDIFYTYIPIDNIIEIKGYYKGRGELILYNIQMKLLRFD